jgi:basic amino acid/polyamine antiporter, APA family
MIGTGIFTSLGFQLSGCTNSISIILLWLVGGLLSFCGALALAELGVAYKKNGGDYLFLTHLMHTRLGYLSAWGSFIVAFTTPITISALAMIKYTEFLHYPYPKAFAIGIIISITLIHSFSTVRSAKFQNLSTLIKIAFIVALIALGFFYAPATHNALLFSGTWKKEIMTSSFATNMIYVFYAYSGWSSAAYIAGDIVNPHKSLPIAILGSTALVTLLYVLLQVVMLRQGNLIEMTNSENVTVVAFSHVLLGGRIRLINIFISLQLVATISSYLWIGSRITHAMSKDQEKWTFLRKVNKNNIPVIALWANAGISILYLCFASLDEALKGTGFIMQAFSILVVYASLKLKKNNEFTTPFKPVPQLLFIGFSLYILINNLVSNFSLNALWLAIILLGFIFYKKPSNMLTTDRPHA